MTDGNFSHVPNMRAISLDSSMFGRWIDGNPFQPNLPMGYVTTKVNVTQFWVINPSELQDTGAIAGIANDPNVQ